VSPIYLDLRLLVSHPRALRLAARAYAGILRGLEYDRVAGIPYAALPIATAIGLEMGQPVIYPRREAKDYGTKAAIEGEYQAGETAVVIDDLATTGGSKLEAIEKLTAAGLRVRDIVVLIDRGQGAAQALAEAAYRLHAVTTLPALLEQWRQAGAVSGAQYREVSAFLAQS
jgi:uridine monophosphate synthetase